MKAHAEHETVVLRVLVAWCVRDARIANQTYRTTCWPPEFVYAYDTYAYGNFFYFFLLRPVISHPQRRMRIYIQPAVLHGNKANQTYL